MAFPSPLKSRLSNLSLEDIIRRTKEYTRRGIYVLWLARWKPALDSGRYTPKPWERWLHAAYFGRVYYWLGQTTVVPYHFDPGHVHVPARTWYDPRGKKKSARGYSRRSLRWIRPVRGQTLNLLTDFNAQRSGMVERRGHGDSAVQALLRFQAGVLEIAIQSIRILGHKYECDGAPVPWPPLKWWRRRKSICNLQRNPVPPPLGPDATYLTVARWIRWV